MPIAILAVLAVIVGVVLVSNSGKKKGNAEVFLQAAADPGADPFTQSAASPTPSDTVPSNTPVSLGTSSATGSAITAPAFPSSPSGPATKPPSGQPLTLRALSGATPGLYGGTRDQRSCDPQRIIDYLAANPAKEQAWADAQGIPRSEVASFIHGLTPVFLRSDTRVTNHGYRSGRATAHQDILQAGTAVLVDQYGVPRSRCACGNPLAPPEAVTPTYQGTPWNGFSPGNVTVINPSPTVINIITIIDIHTGDPYGIHTGPNPGPPLSLPNLPGGGTPNSTPPDTTTTESTTSTTPTVTGVFTLSSTTDNKATLDPKTWTVDPQAGTSTIDVGGTNTASYSWSVPQTIDPAGTKVTFAGSVLAGANMHLDISLSGTGVVFDTTDLFFTSGVSGQKSATVTVTDPTITSVTLTFSMNYGYTVNYTYTR